MTEPEPASDERRLRVAIAGAGIVGLDHAAAYGEHPDAELVAVLGRDVERTAAVAERLGVRAYTDVDVLLATERLDALSVCTPTASHRRFVEAAASAGVHILLEKPMATTVDDCDAIDRVCRAAGVVLMLGFTHRFHPELLEARRRIDAGDIGPPGLVQDVFTFGELEPWPDWYYDGATSGGGELMHDAVHMVDRLAWLLDDPIVEVYGRTTSYARGLPGVEDGGVATLAFAAGAIGSLFVNQASYPLHSDAETVPMPGRMELEIHGPRGTIRYRTWHELVIDVAGQTTTRLVREGPGAEMMAEIDAFLEAVRGRQAPPVGAAEGRRGIAVIQSIYESEHSRRPVVVDELFPVPADLA